VSLDGLIHAAEWLAGVLGHDLPGSFGLESRSGAQLTSSSWSIGASFCLLFITTIVVIPAVIRIRT
jgi:hypothetical protein